MMFLLRFFNMPIFGMKLTWLKLLANDVVNFHHVSLKRYILCWILHLYIHSMKQ